MPMAKIRQLADGRIYTADLAKSEGLIDEIGYLDDAIEQAKKVAQLTRAQVVTYTRSNPENHQNIYSHFEPPAVGPVGFSANQCPYAIGSDYRAARPR